MSENILYLRSNSGLCAPAAPILWPLQAPSLDPTIGRVRREKVVSKVRVTLIEAYARERWTVVNQLAERLYVQAFREWGANMYFGQGIGLMQGPSAWTSSNVQVEPHTVEAHDETISVDGFQYTYCEGSLRLYKTTPVLEWTRGEAFDYTRPWTEENDAVCDLCTLTDPTNLFVRIHGGATGSGGDGLTQYHYVQTAGGPSGLGHGVPEAWIPAASAVGIYMAVKIEVL